MLKLKIAQRVEYSLTISSWLPYQFVPVGHLNGNLLCTARPTCKAHTISTFVFIFRHTSLMYRLSTEDESRGREKASNNNMAYKDDRL